MLSSINALDDRKTRLDKEQNPEKYSPVPINTSGSVTIFNRGHFKTQFVVTFKLGIKRYKCLSDIIHIEKSQQMILPKLAENVRVNILDCIAENAWASITIQNIDPRDHSFFITYGNQGSPMWKQI